MGSLDVHQNLIKPTILLDASIATEANLTWLRENNYSYIVSARQDAPYLELESDLLPVGNAHDLVQVALIKSSDDSEDKWLYCESEAKAAVASQMKQSFRDRLEDDLTKIAAGLLKPRGRKKDQKILARIGRLIKQFCELQDVCRICKTSQVFSKRMGKLGLSFL